MDPYSVLGLSSTATDAQIKTAYRLKARLLHPDQHVGSSLSLQEEAQRSFQDLQSAYHTLSTPTRRKAHDDKQKKHQSPHADKESPTGTPQPEAHGGSIVSDLKRLLSEQIAKHLITVESSAAVRLFESYLEEALGPAVEEVLEVALSNEDVILGSAVEAIGRASLVYQGWMSKVPPQPQYLEVMRAAAHAQLDFGAAVSDNLLSQIRFTRVPPVDLLMSTMPAYRSRPPYPERGSSHGGPHQPSHAPSGADWLTASVITFILVAALVVLGTFVLVNAAKQDDSASAPPGVDYESTGLIPVGACLATEGQGSSRTWFEAPCSDPAVAGLVVGHVSYGERCTMIPGANFALEPVSTSAMVECVQITSSDPALLQEVQGQ